jgi:phosphatidylserine/phosphatidylglycerophosphate/cardiolipin synthase-like enzyme
VAKFLDTTGVSHYLQLIINQAQSTLVLISPYLKINERLRQSLADKDRMKIDIRIVYGKSELEADQVNWLKDLKSVRVSFCKNLHAKCYLNEEEAILTSMNLYEFSQVNNEEMGIHVSKNDDPELYKNIHDAAQRLIRISQDTEIAAGREAHTPREAPQLDDWKGHCIRCGNAIDLDPDYPYCDRCYRVWRKYGDPDYKEEYCHICGRACQSTMNKPLCYSCYSSLR